MFPFLKNIVAMMGRHLKGRENDVGHIHFIVCITTWCTTWCRNWRWATLISRWMQTNRNNGDGTMTWARDDELVLTCQNWDSISRCEQCMLLLYHQMFYSIKKKKRKFPWCECARVRKHLKRSQEKCPIDFIDGIFWQKMKACLLSQCKSG